MAIKQYKLLDFLETLGYSKGTREAFDSKVLTLCGFTKCRAEPERKVGYESCHLFIALARKFGFKRFLEFGTGRGTTSFLMASMPDTEHVVTIDIVAHEEQRHTWCDYKTVFMSNAQIHDKCAEALGEPHAEIERWCINSSHLAPTRIKSGPFDLVYIDGSHDYEPVKKDFAIAQALLADDAVVVFDDYDPRYGVHQAINELLKDEDCILVSVNGHIYGPNEEPNDCGHIIWAKGKYKELLSA